MARTAEDKILTLDALADKVRALRAAGRKVVQSHGVFDLIHPGIIHHLRQARALGEVMGDLASGRPMNRLLQGDVGSGKTALAILAALAAAHDGLQSAVMAPTEILAEQHHLTLKRLLARCPYRVELLTSAVNSRPSCRATLTSSAPSTTWLLVRM